MFKPTTVTYRKSGNRLTPDDLFWKTLKSPTLVEETGQVTHLDFNPNKPHDLAVTASAKVSIYSTSSVEVQRSFSRFKSAARGAVWRSDGALLGAGDDEGVVRVFAHGSSTSALRIYKGHQAATHRVAFVAGQSALASFSDDKTVRVWDLSRSDGRGPIAVLRGHSDYIRAAAASASNPNLLVSGSYDHSAMLWDVRAEEMSGKLEHGAPIDALALFPNDGLLATGGGTVLKIWDLRRLGGTPVAVVSRHSKAITGLAFSADRTRLVSASLDRQLKWYDTATYDVVHSLKAAGPILSFAIAPGDGWLALGLAGTRTLSVQQRAEPQPTRVERLKRPTGLKKGDYTADPKTQKVVVSRDVSGKLPRHDDLMRRFRHTEALDVVLKNKFLRKQRPELVASVLKELSRRGALRAALAGRDGASLALLTTFLKANLSKARFTPLLLPVATLLLDVYSGDWASLSPGAVAAFSVLSDAVEREAEQAMLLQLTQGALALITNSAHL